VGVKVPARCGPGDILRGAFGTKKEKRKSAAMGCGCQMSETPGTFHKLDKKDLGGWEAKKSESKRRKKLEKAVKKHGCRSVLWGLSMAFMAAKDEKTKSAARSDAFWLQHQESCGGKK
jgi:hypothetical protein